MRKNNFFALVTLIGFLLPTGAMALPKMAKVESGMVNMTKTDSSMIIETSDNAIVDYKSFGIAENERVQFIQQSTTSVVLNRIVGEDASKILGTLNSNGKIFLVNPNGVYFGQDAKVDVGSLISSTLDIANDSFLAGNYKFINSGSDGSIINFGSLSAPDGVIALISDEIKNEGVISAKAGKVVLATGENVVIDFYGDGLMNFVVDNNICDGRNNIIQMKADNASNIILDVVNNDEILEGTTFVKRDGIISIVEDSFIEANEVVICGKENSTIVVSGTINASNKDIGGKVGIFGEKITVDKAKIIADGDTKGGEIFIGGNWYGENSFYNAKETNLTKNSVISANALIDGDGGKICVWSDDFTTFNGNLLARGGQNYGKGGFVETSSGGFVCSLDSYVDTYSVSSEHGMWSIDPAHIIIGSRGVDSLDSASEANDTLSLRMINAAVFRKATSNVALRAVSETGTITVDEGISINIPDGYDISFDVDPTYGVVFLKTGSSIETSNGNVIFNGPVMLEGDSCFIKTNANGLTGGDVIFNYAINGKGLSDLNIDAGEGNVIFSQEVGKKIPIGVIDIKAGNIDLYANVNTKGRSITFNGPINFYDDLSIDTAVNSNTGSNITFNESINGSYNLVVNAADSVFTHMGNIGGKVPLKSIKVKASNTVTGGNVYTYGGTQIYASPLTLGGSGVTITHEDTGPDGILYLSAIAGNNNNLIATAKAGSVVFSEAITAIGNADAAFTITARHVIQQSSVVINDNYNLSYTGKDSIVIGGNITVGGDGTISINNPCQISGDVTFDRQAGTGTITVNGLVEGTGNFQISGAGGPNVFQTDPIEINSFTITGTTNTISVPLIATGDVSITASSTTTITGEVTTVGSSISFLGAGGLTLGGNVFTGNGNFSCTNAITLNTTETTYTINVGGGTATFSGNVTALDTSRNLHIVGDNTGICTFSSTVGAGTRINNFSVSIGIITFTGDVDIGGAGSFYSNAININNSLVRSIGGSLSFNGPIVLGDNVTIDTSTSGNDITFLSTIDSDSNASYRNLTINAGAAGGVVAFYGDVGVTRYVGNFAVTAYAMLLGGNIWSTQSSGALTLTTTIRLVGDSTIFLADSGATLTLGSSSSSAIDGSYDLHLLVANQSASAITINSTAGATAPLRRLEVKTGAGGTIISKADITTTGGQVYFNKFLMNRATAGVLTYTDYGDDGITFVDTVNGTLTANDSLVCNAVNGSVSFQSTVGDDTPTTKFGYLTVTARNILQQSTVATGTNMSITYTGGNSVITGAGVSTNGTGSIAIDAGDEVILGGGVAAPSTGTVAVTGGRVVDIEGAVTSGANGGTAINLAGGSSLTVSGAVTASGTGNLVFSGGNSLTITGAVTGTGGTITATGGEVVISGAVGSTGTNASITVTGYDSVIFGSTLTMTGSMSPLSTAIAITGGDLIVVGGTVSVTGNGAITLTSAGAGGIQLGGNVTNGGSGDITFNSPISASGARTISTTSGAITINGMTGKTGAITCATSGNLTLSQDAVEAHSFDANGVAGTIAVNVPIHTIGDILLGQTSSSLTVASGNDLATEGGAITLVATSGTLTLTDVDMTSAGGDISISANTFNYGGNINTGNGNFTITGIGALLLTADTIFQLGSGTGSGISTINSSGGARSLKVVGDDASSMSISGAIGGSSALSGLVVEIGTFSQASSCVTTGAVTYRSNDITIGGSITTTNSTVSITGPVTISGTPTISVGSGNIYFLTSQSSIDGSTTLTLTSTGKIKLEGEIGGITSLTGFTAATGSVLLGNNITSSGAIALNGTSGTLTLIGNSQIYSSGSSVTLTGTVNGFYNLLLEASGAVTCSSDVGGLVALRTFTTHGSSISVKNVNARY